MSMPEPRRPVAWETEDLRGLHDHAEVRTWTELTDGTLDNPITIDELGLVASDNSVWTGTSAAGEAASPSCQGWTSPKKGDPGMRGIFGEARLICVEQ